MLKKVYLKSIEYFIYILPLSIVLSNFSTNFIIYYISIFGFFQLIFKRQINIINNKYSFVFILFCIYITTRSLFVADHNILFSLKSSATLIRYLFFYTAIVFMIQNNPKFIGNFIKFASIFLLFISIDGSIQFFIGKNLMGHSDENYNRISGLFEGKYVLGSYISKIIILYLFLLNFKYPFIKFKLVYFLIIIFSFFVILISGDRSALGIFIISIFSLIILLDNNYLDIKLKPLIISLIVLITIGLINFSEIIKSRFLHQSLNDFNTAENILYFTKGHESHWKTSHKMYLDNKIFGKGPNMFRKYCDHPKYNSGIKSCSTHPHNYYFQLLGETGLIGFILFCSIYCTICLRLLKQFYLVIINKKKFLNLNELFISIIFFSNFWPLITTGNFFGSFSLNLLVLPICFAKCKEENVK